MYFSKKLSLIFTFGIVLALALVVSFAEAKKPGGGGGHGGGGTTCDGQPIEVLDNDFCGSSMWIQVEDSTTVCNIVCWLTSKRRQCPVGVYWIGGIVVEDASAPLGFRSPQRSELLRSQRKEARRACARSQRIPLSTRMPVTIGG